MGSVLIRNHGQSVSITDAKNLDGSKVKTASVYTDAALTSHASLPYDLGDNTVVYLSNGDRTITFSIDGMGLTTERVMVQKTAQQTVDLPAPEVPRGAQIQDTNLVLALPDVSALTNRQAFVSALTAAGGRQVIIRGAEYVLDQYVDIPDGTWLTGMPGATVTCAAPNRSVLSVGSNVRLEGVTIKNTDLTAGGNIGISVRPSAVNVSLRNLKFTGASGMQGIQVGAAGISGVTVDSCDFESMEFGILTNGQGVGGADDLKNVTVTNCTFKNMSSDGVEFNHPGDTFTARTSATGFLVSGCTFDTCSEFGVGVAGASNVAVANNVFRNCGKAAIHVEDQTYGLTVASNVVEGTTVGGAYGAIEVLASDSLSITGNSIRNAAAYGIFLIYNSDVIQNTNAVISGNVVTAAGSDGIYVGGGVVGGYQAVSGNVVTSCGGNGVTLAGEAGNLLVSANVIHGNTGYGISPSASRSLRLLGSNVISGNTAGPLAGRAISTGVASMTTSCQGSGTTTSGEDTMNVPLFRAGLLMQGYVFVTAQHTSAGRADALFSIDWDGTTLHATRKLKRDYGVMEVSSLSIVDGVLNAAIYAPGLGSADADGTFQGVFLEDSVARTGTVSAT